NSGKLTMINATIANNYGVAIDNKDSSCSIYGENVTIVNNKKLYSNDTKNSNGLVGNGYVYVTSILQDNDSVVDFTDIDSIKNQQLRLYSHAGTALAIDDKSIFSDFQFDYAQIFGTNYELKDNGGYVETLALSANSLAVASDKKYFDNNQKDYTYRLDLNDTGLKRQDSRGFMSNGYRDFGAYEYNGIVAFNSDTGVGYSTVTAAVGAAVSGQTIELANTRLNDRNIGGNIIIGAGKDIIISGQGDGAYLDMQSSYIRLNDNVTNSIFVRITNITFANNNNESVIVNVNNNLLLDKVNFLNNNRAIDNIGGYVVVENSLFMNNGNANIDGGAIRVGNNGNLYVGSSSLYNNHAQNGGAIYFTGNGTIVLDGVTMGYNSAAGGRGGAVYVDSDSGILDIRNSTIASNMAGIGSAVYAYSSIGELTFGISSSTIAYNVSTIEKGAVYNDNVRAYLLNTLITENYFLDNGILVDHAPGDPSSTEEYNIGGSYLGFNSIITTNYVYDEKT
ncbi:MAG: hypothetical protein RR060_02580, partial [Victivallaceae bacterium]